MNTYLATNFNHVLKRAAIATLLTVGFFTFQTTLAETAIWDGTMVRPTEGSGTEDDPYLINTAEEMAYLIRNYDYNDGICYRNENKDDTTATEGTQFAFHKVFSEYAESYVVTFADKYSAITESFNYYRENILSKKTLRYAYLFLSLFLIRI